MNTVRLVMTFFTILYNKILFLVMRSQDPSVNVVLLEDFAAVIGIVVAGGCICISTITKNPIPDSIGCLLVGCILGSVAFFIIYSNVAALVGR